ncbi:helix-turn-helix transcriptional regulator [Terrihabitans sp. B22-R8]|uniref:helix-turn-helix transcriptional regulator n=1 Tax=Terrihabitans sp. B22-R8 TaxID=3425128 RepID=UPI00403C2E92
MPSQPHTVSTHLGGAILIAAGDTLYAEPAQVTSPIRDGVRLLVVLNGQMSLGLEGQTPIDIQGPSVIAVISDGEIARDQVFREGQPFRYVLIQIDRGLIRREHGADPADIVRASSPIVDLPRIVIGIRPADPASEAVAAQILACPEGRDHDLYRFGKALELSSLVLDGFDAARSQSSSRRLPPADADRIRHARDLMMGSIDTPPDIAALAVQIGMNAGKLNRGFRILYGTTPYAFLQEHRLQTAYRMLAGGHQNVGQVAGAVGYTQAHFATLFGRRFGMPPSALLPKNF